MMLVQIATQQLGLLN